MCCVVLCCVVFKDCTGGILLVKRFAENKSNFFTPRYNFYTPISRLPKKVEATKNKISTMHSIPQFWPVSRVLGGILGKIYEL